MQERNTIEAETRERLTNLLSLILTSSKTQDFEQDSMVSPRDSKHYFSHLFK